MVLLDAHWWVGGNRERGIGRYLDAFFRSYCSIPVSERVWVFPVHTPDEQKELCVRRYGGKAVEIDLSRNLAESSQQWQKLVEEYEPRLVFIPSPFERPWSFLQLGEALFGERGTKDARFEYDVEAIIFDLLPAEYPAQILRAWPEQDQSEYRERLQQVSRCKRLYAISPSVKKSIVQILQVPTRNVTVLEFGMAVDWLAVPGGAVGQGQPRLPHRPIAISISGGEWRKNLAGTLEYYAAHLAATYDLVVVCRLSIRERLRFTLLAWQLGVGPRVHFTGELSEEKKWQYLLSAEVGVFLSHAEGLGIPLLEYTRAAIPRIITSSQIQSQKITDFLPDYTEIATEISE